MTIRVGSGSCFARAEQAEEDLLELRDDDDHDDRDRTDSHKDNRRRVDRSRNDASLQFDDLFDQGRETLQDQIEHTARFTGFDHVRVKRVENFRVFFERGEKGRAFLDILPDLPQHVLEKDVLLLFGQNVDTLHERQTRVDHHRKLAREYGQLLGLDLFAAAELGYRDLAAFFLGLRHDDLLAAKQGTQLVLVGGFLFAGDQFV